MSDETKQKWDPQDYHRYVRFTAESGKPLFDLLQPKSGERILDLGCGHGVLAAKLQSMDCQVVGVDSSPEMIEAARERGVDAFVVDGHALMFDNEFDGVLSHAALHWMVRPELVVAGVWRALIDGGRFVAEFGGEGNVATIVDQLLESLRSRGVAFSNPWYFPSKAEYSELLREQGFEIASAELFPLVRQLPGDLRAWLSTFAQQFTKQLPDSEHEGFLDEVAEHLEPQLKNQDGNWIADYVRLRIKAIKPTSNARA